MHFVTLHRRGGRAGVRDLGGGACGGGEAPRRARVDCHAAPEVRAGEERKAVSAVLSSGPVG